MQVKVWNRNTHPFSQKLKGVDYQIPALASITLDFDDADMLVKSFSPIEVDYDNKPLPTSYKKLEIDAGDVLKYRELSANKAKGGTYVCQACGYVSTNKWELKGHVMSEHSQDFEDKDQAIDALAEEDKPKRSPGNVRKKV